ncbi:MAG: proline dipeptidase [Clostridiaceae bacterium]|jgi:Xaa-Pro dipeptidase|nr:proline dipeptidase [Clostridiaceae bacterium]
MNEQRIQRVIERMKELNVTQTIVTSTPDLFYLMGKWIESGERMIALYLNTNGDKKLIINEIVTNLKDLTGVEILSYTDDGNPLEMLSNVINSNEPLAVDKFWHAHFLIELMEKVPQLKPINSKAVDAVRMEKDITEKKLLQEAADVVDKAVIDLIDFIKKNPHTTENKAAEKLKDIFASYGTYEYSFDPIIAYGENGADPHHTTDSVSKLKKGDSIVIDIGGRTNLYCSDTTRTVFYDHCSEEAEKVYNTVKAANLAAISMVKAGVRFCDIDRTARKVIEDAGYGKYFTHRTGHSIGIEDHENPSVSSTDETIVKEGMAFSIEPGIYLPGKFGVRIEDIVIATKDGCVILNKTSKELTII